jgi:hypothetical protein
MREPSEYEAPLCASVGGDFWFPEKVAGGSKRYRDCSYG